MKIQNDRIEGFLPQEHTQKTTADRKAFEEMLSQQLGQGQNTAPSISGMQNLDALMIMGGTGLEGTAEDAELAGLFTQAEELLGDWEAYAKTLGAGQDKAAWSQLAGLDTRIQGLRGEVGQLGSRGEGLDAVLNELEVLTATEKFKFNRGDYQ